MFVTPDGAMMMSEYNQDHEDEADWFAGTVLLPREALLALIANGVSDREACAQYGVSASLYRMRRNRTGVDLQLSRRPQHA
jgi:Zn-dependent peptidase ImmA (M78 family)